MIGLKKLLTKNIKREKKIMSKWEFEPQIDGQGTVQDAPETDEDTNEPENEYNDAIEFDAKGGAGGESDTAIEDESPEQPDPVLATPVKATPVEDFTKQARPLVVPENDVKIKVDPNTLPISEKTGYNPNTIQSPLTSRDIEGGIVKPKKQRGVNLTQGGKLFNKNGSRTDESIIMNGFFVEGTDGSMVEVDKEYATLEVAMSTVINSKYMMVIDGEPVLAEIIEGEPRITVGDVERNIYINGSWNK